MKTTKMTPFFHLLFLLYLQVKFISEFENTKTHFQFHYFGPFWSVKYLNFLPKATDLDSSSYFFQKVDTLRLLKICIMFCLPADQIPIFLGSSSWTILGVEEKFIPNLFAFLLHFW